MRRFLIDKFVHAWQIWPAGSLEEKVQNLVKTWEMEIFHKTNPNEYKSLDPKKYTFSLNGNTKLFDKNWQFFVVCAMFLCSSNLYTWFTGRKPINFGQLRQLGGGYNPLMLTSLPEKLRVYNPADETAQTSHLAFTTAFPRGFALEILHVYTGPPVIVYKFRHWGFVEGPFKGHAPTGEMVEFFGMAVFEVPSMLKSVFLFFFFGIELNWI